MLNRVWYRLLIREDLGYSGKGIKTKNPNISIRVLWYLQGSNQGHMDFQSIALPSELRYLAIAGANIE
jgi:hypothetical protein